MEWEAQDEGVLAKILQGDGAKDIAVGTPVAVVVEDAGDVSLGSNLLGKWRQLAAMSGCLLPCNSGILWAPASVTGCKQPILMYAIWAMA